MAEVECYRDRNILRQNSSRRSRTFSLRSRCFFPQHQGSKSFTRRQGTYVVAIGRSLAVYRSISQYLAVSRSISQYLAVWPFFAFFCPFFPPAPMKSKVGTKVLVI